MTTYTYMDLEIGFTSCFQLQWNDQGSGGSRNGAYWRPILDPNSELAAPNALGKVFKPVGDLGWSTYDNVNGKATIVMVRERHDPDNTHLQPSVMPPTGFEPVWSDRGSGADRDGSMWRPYNGPQKQDHMLRY